MKNNEGYLYIARGERYIKEAENSLQSLKKVYKISDVTLITNKPYQSSNFDNIIILDDNFEDKNIEAKNLKIKGLLHSPYRKTIFVDTDTYFCDPCSELFLLLDYYDIMFAQAPADKRLVNIDGKNINGYYPYNSGVIVYNKNEKTNKLFKKWLEIFQYKFNLYWGDQPALMEAFLHCNLKIYTFPNIYNFRFNYYNGIIDGKIKILHGRTDNYSILEKVINKVECHRGWNPTKQKILYSEGKKKL
ncbi:MAG: hypothetical protein K9H26_10095 [Prolixibacteraceae bacterium]|nr:hypothetical protein [Prolixibacteraceae bacterium]